MIAPQKDPEISVEISGSFFVGISQIFGSPGWILGGGDPRISLEISGYRCYKPISSEVGGGKFTGDLRREWPKRPDFRGFPMKSSDLGGGKTQPGLLRIWESFLRIFLFDKFATRDFIQRSCSDSIYDSSLRFQPRYGT